MALVFRFDWAFGSQAIILCDAHETEGDDAAFKEFGKDSEPGLEGHFGVEAAN